MVSYILESEFIYPQVFEKINLGIGALITGGTVNGTILTLNLFNGSIINIDGFTSGNTSNNNNNLLNNVYNYSTWSGDTVSGATRQAIANIINTLDTYITGGTFSTGHTLTLFNNKGQFININNIENFLNKNISNGYAGLDINAKVSKINSYVLTSPTPVNVPIMVGDDPQIVAEKLQGQLNKLKSFAIAMAVAL